MPLYIADYLADTGHMSTVEHGAYLLLIMHYWQNSGLPSDDAKLARVCRLPLKQWMEIRPTIADLFGLDWHHGRIDSELAKAEDTISKRSAAGKAAAYARHNKRSANAPSNAQQTFTPHLTSPEEEREKGAGATLHRGWVPRPETLQWVALKSIPDTRRDAMIEHFVEHHLGKGTVFADPDAAFRTWVIRNPQFVGRADDGGGAGRGRRPDNGFATAVGEVVAGSRLRRPHDG
jgi:uncharacterized protein YdaU (DUF1376 family)